jgi:hypothetical protein
MPMNVTDPQKTPHFRIDNVRWFRHPEKIEGFEVLRSTDPQGTVVLQAPALNGETLVSQRVDGSRQVFSDIKLGEQPETLFRPPAGAVIQLASQDVMDKANRHTPK